MKVKLNDKEFSFSFAGFGPQYIYETLQGEVFTGVRTRNVHILLYSTLLFCNKEAFDMTIDDFTTWLYEHPEEEEMMTTAIVAEVERRNSLRAKKKE
jgi:hypothetical protein